jgi:hypothetical protein
MEIIQGAMEYEEMNIVLRTEERRGNRERARDIYLSTPWELSKCGMSPDIPNKYTLTGSSTDLLTLPSVHYS